MGKIGEYIKYKGNKIKIGNGENLYFTSYQKYSRALKAGLLSAVPGQAKPEYYVRHNAGIRFRFPFPDEDKLPCGEIGNSSFDRGVRIKVNSQGNSRWEEQTKLLAGETGILEIVQQKMIYQVSDGLDSGRFLLALIIRNPESQNYFRIADPYCIDKLNENIIQNNIQKETDPKRRHFFRKLSARILNGYKQNITIPHVIYSPKRKIRNLKRGKVI